MKLVAGVNMFTSDEQTWCYGRNTLRLVLNLPEIDSGIYSELVPEPELHYISELEKFLERESSWI